MLINAIILLCVRICMREMNIQFELRPSSQAKILLIVVIINILIMLAVLALGEAYELLTKRKQSEGPNDVDKEQSDEREEENVDQESVMSHQKIIKKFDVAYAIMYIVFYGSAVIFCDNNEFLKNDIALLLLTGLLLNIFKCVALIQEGINNGKKKDLINIFFDNLIDQGIVIIVVSVLLLTTIAILAFIKNFMGYILLALFMIPQIYIAYRIFRS